MNPILSALQWRYAVRVFDVSRKVSDDDVKTILEAGRLAPSSFGIEPWQFIVVENSAMRTALRAVSYDQPKVTDASHLLIIARRTDARESIVKELIERTAATQGVDASALEGLKNMVDGTIAAKSDDALDAWIRSQSYIPLGVMITAAAMLGVDSGPMEGFDPAQVDALLGLTEKNLTATTMLALGYRGNDEAANRPKVRRAYEDVVTHVA